MQQDLCDRMHATSAGHCLQWLASCITTSSGSGKSYVQLLGGLHIQSKYWIQQVAQQ